MRPLTCYKKYVCMYKLFNIKHKNDNLYDFEQDLFPIINFNFHHRKSLRMNHHAFSH